MKTEINNENKARFFAQYWGQLVLRSLTNGGNFHLYQVGFGNQYYNELDYLELKPFSSISDEDAIEVAKIVCARHNRHYKESEITYKMEGKWKVILMVKNIERYEIHIMSDGIGFVDRLKDGCGDKNYYCPSQFHVSDFLRSHGYLVPFKGLTCEEIIEAGWAKYKEP